MSYSENKFIGKLFFKTLWKSEANQYLIQALTKINTKNVRNLMNKR